MPLFETKGLVHPSLTGELKGYVRVENDEEFREIFRRLLCMQSDTLYNHSPIFPFSYLNVGEYKLYLNDDFNNDKIIPVVQKHGLASTFSIYCPHAHVEDILQTVALLDRVSLRPTIITDLTDTFVSGFKVGTSGWKAVKTSDDVIHDAKKVTWLQGRVFSSIRNTLKHVRNDLNPTIEPLNGRNYLDALQVFEDWKETQGKKYFRATIGRDLRLIEEFFDKVDLQNYFSYVYYVKGIPSACSFGCRALNRPDWGIDVAVKARIDCKGLSDFAFQHLITQMHAKGIAYVNDSGYNSPGNKINKMKWQPSDSIACYNLVRQ